MKKTDDETRSRKVRTVQRSRLRSLSQHELACAGGGNEEPDTPWGPDYPTPGNF